LELSVAVFFVLLFLFFCWPPGSCSLCDAFLMDPCGNFSASSWFLENSHTKLTWTRLAPLFTAVVDLEPLGVTIHKSSV
jgi:hypothetical protein